MNRFFKFIICIMISCIFAVMGCKSKESSKSVNKLHKQSRKKGQKNTSKKNYEKIRIPIQTITSLKIINSGTDDTDLELEWNAESIKGIMGHFDIYRKYGHGEYEHIAKTEMYDGKKANLSQYTWKEPDKSSGIYMHSNLKSELSLPLNRYVFQVRFQPFYKTKYIIQEPSNEVEAHIVPKDANMAMYDIVETLQNAYTKECGFFSSFPIVNSKVIKPGEYSGIFTRELNIDNQVIYTFDHYSNFGSIYITGQLQSSLKVYKDKTGANKMQPRQVSGILKVAGIYKAEVQIQNLIFDNECGTSLTNGEVRINYIHPSNGQMKAGFTGSMVPHKLLSYFE